MGRIVTPRYRVEYRTNLMALRIEGADCASRVDGKAVKVVSWHSTSGPNRVGLGAPTDKNLESWRNALNASFRPGGVNEHISKAFNSLPNVTYARIVDQRTDSVVAEYTAPMFEAA